MRILLLFIFPFFMSCAPTEPVEKYNDLSVLQDFINNSPNIDMSFDTDSSNTIEPMELGVQVWENGRITVLNCYNRGLSGSIPESIGNLSALTQLGLRSNSLSGEIPESIGNLIQLTQLNLAENSLSGSIPDAIGNLKSLTNLVLSNNELSGNIPNSIMNLSVLHTFLVDSNNLSGTLPDDICTLYPNLIDYSLAENHFCPILPTCLDTPDKIGFQNCDTSCGIEYEYKNGYCYSLNDLNVLRAITNNNLNLNMFFDDDSNGNIDELELGFQEWSAGRLEILDCYRDTVSCNISISLPENLSVLDSLTVLDLGKNNLQGNLTESLIQSLDGLLNFRILNITDNQISGYLPENICNIDSVLLDDNQFCPCYFDCENRIITSEEHQDTTGCSVCEAGYSTICDDLNENHVGKNNLNPHNFINFTEEPICYKQSNLDILQAFIDSSISTLNINPMDIDSSGIIEPFELGEQSWIGGDLIALKASHLELSGRIPDGIGYLNNVDTLHLNNNNLSGIIPDGICELTNLIWSIDSSTESNAFLYNNNFCPPYPDCGIGIITSEEYQDTTGCSSEE